MHDHRNFFWTLVGDGRSLINLTAIALIASGLFAIFLGIRGEFLPHDIDFLGSSTESLRSIADARLVYFMIHDRVAFGGTLIAVGTLYLWLVAFPLASGQSWAWWTLFVSGVVGFGSFLAYLGYGYLDSWHGIATLVLLPIYVLGMMRAFASLERPRSIKSLVRKSHWGRSKSMLGFGRFMLLLTSTCLFVGGLIVMTVGMTTVFVPEDLDYLRLQPAELDQMNPRLIPLIAHDRAGFGGGICCCGLTMFFCVFCGTPSRSLWQALFLTGLAGFGTGIGVHYPIGYTCFTHLAPAYLGAFMLLVGLALTYSAMVGRRVGRPTLSVSKR